MNALTPPTATPRTMPSTQMPTQPPVRPLPFSAEEVAAFQAQDKQMARAVVGIMLAIFTAALIGYTFICFWAAWG